MLTLAYTEELRRAVGIAQAIAREYQHPTFSPGHLLKGLLHNDVGLASQLTVWDIDVPYLRDWADIRIEGYPKSARTTQEPTGDAQIRALMEVSDVVRMKLGETELGPLAVLTAMCKPDVAFSRDQLKSFPLTETQLLEKAVMDAGFQQAVNGQTGGVAGNGKSNNGQPASSAPPATGKTSPRRWVRCFGLIQHSPRSIPPALIRSAQTANIASRNPIPQRSGPAVFPKSMRWVSAIPIASVSIAATDN